MLRDFSLSLTFIAILLVAYTAIVLYGKKTGDANTRATLAVKPTASDQPAVKTTASSPAN